MPHYNQAKLDEITALLVNEGCAIETVQRENYQVLVISSGTLPKLEMYWNEETGALRVVGNDWPTEVYARIDAALSNQMGMGEGVPDEFLTCEFDAVHLTNGPVGRTSFWFFSDDDIQRDELIRVVKAIFAIAGVLMPRLNAFA
jgi:hypothetical protein